MVAFRSISLPSRLHTNSTKIEAQPYKLKSYTAYSRTSENVQSNLADLYNSVEELMRSPTTQNSLDGKIVVEALEGSVELLDSCETIRELALMMKEHVQVLQSALRRKGAQDCTIQDEMNMYFGFRKRMNKCIARSLKRLKQFERRKWSTSLDLNLDNNESNTSLMFIEVSNMATSVFRSLLVFLSSPASTTKWPLVSKMMIKKNENFCVIGDVGSVDFALDLLLSSIRSSSATVIDVQMVQHKLQNLGDSIEGLELGLERIFRQLVQSRVTLLNILTDH